MAWYVKNQENKNQGDTGLHQKHQKLGQNVRGHDLNRQDSRHPRSVQKAVLFLRNKGFSGQGHGQEKYDDNYDSGRHEFRETGLGFSINGCIEFQWHFRDIFSQITIGE